MRLLAFDCAFSGHSAALWEDGRAIAHAEEEAPHTQSARLMPDIERLMAEAGWSYRHLDGIACTIGPGSFTGLRIGLATAKGLAMGADVPLLPIGTLEALAAGVRKEREEALTVAVNALKGQLYMQSFDARLEAVAPPCAVDVAAAASALPEGSRAIAGSGVALLGELPSRYRPLPQEARRVDARALAAFAAARPGRAKPGHTVHPIYLRPPDAKKMASKKELKERSLGS